MTIYSPDTLGDDRRIPKAALLLGWAGVIPFAAGAIALLLRTPDSAWIIVPFLTYGAVILSFLGGVRWGFACRLPGGEDQARQLAASVIPSLVGWVGVSMAPHLVTAFGLLIAGHAAQAVWDIRDARGGRLPAWYGLLRLQLGTAAVATLLLGSLALALR